MKTAFVDDFNPETIGFDQQNIGGKWGFNMIQPWNHGFRICVPQLVDSMWIVNTTQLYMEDPQLD